ncbi:uncharacterized protein LOC131597316 [Vicia villosa]|uniref:uncharacterized protein LOC131597316 n=1 Tax=Vicia villosa TaxID=3911 RepID=UPI00273B8F93|nr:uncharacterized protein LOC131597316 [Vicia villosa]
MAGRNDDAIAAALEAMAQALEHQSNRENPPVFKGTHDPDGALTWLKEIERIFHVMDCTSDQKVQEFLRKYFPEDVPGKKEIEFLELRQGNKSVVEYATSLFENGLCPEIKNAVSYQKIRVFAYLVDSCRIYEEDDNVHYRVINEKRGLQFRLVYSDKFSRLSGLPYVQAIPPKPPDFLLISKLALVLSAMNREMVIDSPAKGSVTTSLVCFKCHMSIFDRDFVVDFICLPLRGLDVILGMSLLENNHVHINCYDKSVRFSTPEEEGVESLSTRQMRMLMK